MGTPAKGGAHEIEAAGGRFTFDAMGFTFQIYVGGSQMFGNMERVGGRFERFECRWSAVSRVAFTSSAEDPAVALYVWGLPAGDQRGWSDRVGAHMVAHASDADRSRWVKVASAMAEYSGGRVVVDLSALPKESWWRNFW